MKKFCIINTIKFCVFIIIIILITSCNSLKKIVYKPDLIQGNYIFNDINKINIGMNKQQVIDIIGYPIILNPFSKNTWFYIFRKQFSNETTIQQTLILNFNYKEILIKIDKKYLLIKNI